MYLRFAGILPTLLAAAGAAHAAAPLELSTIGDEKYAEQVVAMVDLSDGSFARIRFGVSNVGPGDGKGGCTFQLIDPAGHLFADEIVVDRKDWSYDPRSGTLSIGPCTANGGEKLRMRAPLKKGTVEIVLEAAPKRERVHAAKVGDDFYELDTLIMWADAQVRIERDGKTRTISGRGYADHPRSKILPTTLAEKWLRFRGLESDDPRVVLIRFPKNGRPVGWHASNRGRSKLDRAMLAPGRGGKSAMWRARMKGEGGEWRITTTRLLQRSAPVEERGVALGSIIGAIVGNPVTYTYRGVLEERGTGAKIPGIIEVTVTDE